MVGTPWVDKVLLTMLISASVFTFSVQACSPPSITTQPADQPATIDSTATFSIASAGTAPLSYQWYKNGTLIPGAVLTSYTTPAAIPTDNGLKYYCIITNSCGSTQSRIAVLNVFCSPLRITSQPVSQKIKARSPTFDTVAFAYFSIVASGSEPLTYQWQYSSDYGSTWDNAKIRLWDDCCAEGMTTASYTTTEVQTNRSHDGDKFRCIVTDACKNADTSDAAVITVTTDSCIWFTTQPISQSVTLGSTVTFTAVATGASPRSIQWYKNVPITGQYEIEIPGANSESYTTPAATIDDNGTYYYCFVSGPCGYPVRSNIGGIYIQPTKPTLLSPLNGATNQSVNVLLSWSAPGASVCTLQVSTSQDFSSNMRGYVIFTAAGTSQALALLGNTTYYWRVNAANSSGASEYSTIWSFSTGVALPAIPLLSVPSNDATGVSTSPTLKWVEASGATTYHVQVSTSITFSAIFIEDSMLTADSMKLGGLTNDTTYYWRVQAKNTAGKSIWSTIFNFKVESTASSKNRSLSHAELKASFMSNFSNIEVRISIPENFQPCTEVMLNAITGRLVGHWKLSGKGIKIISIDAKNLKSGMYIFRIVNGKNIIKRKLPVAGFIR
jgi:hypothetical protein